MQIAFSIIYSSLIICNIILYCEPNYSAFNKNKIIISEITENYFLKSRLSYNVDFKEKSFLQKIILDENNENLIFDEKLINECAKQFDEIIIIDVNYKLDFIPRIIIEEEKCNFIYDYNFISFDQDRLYKGRKTYPIKPKSVYEHLMEPRASFLVGEPIYNKRIVLLNNKTKDMYSFLIQLNSDKSLEFNLLAKIVEK